MFEICNIVLTNALLAVGLAILVAVVCSRIKSPAIRHVLWLLVLIRLMIPPVWVIDFTPSVEWLRTHVLHQAAQQHVDLHLTLRSHYQAIRKATWDDAAGFVPVRSIFTSSINERDEDASLAVAATPSGQTISYLVRPLWPWSKAALLCVWLLGMLACIVGQVTAIMRFRRQIGADAYRSRIWQQRAEKLAQRAGIARAPRVLMVREAISPMLWGLGRNAQILLPDRLMEQLDHRAQNGLIYHELAHYHRGDHWVRLLESFALIIFWWHPVYWWARHEIFKSEEQCCDLLAIAYTCGDRRTYAEALLKAVDFVSATTFLPTASKAVQSGLLRIRIRQIMAKRQLRARGRQLGPGVLLVFAAALLPFPSVSPSNATPVTTVLPLASVEGLPPTSPDCPRHDTPGAVQSSDVLNTPPAADCGLLTDDLNRSELRATNGQVVDLGVGRVAQSAWSQGRDRIAIGTTDGVVEVYSVQTGACYLRIPGSAQAISDLNFSSDGSCLAFSNRLGEVTVVNASDGHRLLRIRKQNAQDIEVTFDNDQHLLLRWTQHNRICQESLRFVGEQ